MMLLKRTDKVTQLVQPAVLACRPGTSHILGSQ